MANIPSITTTDQSAGSYRMNNHGIDMQESITLAFTAAGTLAKGTVLGKITASGKYAAYNDGHSDGTEVARGILTDSITVTAAGDAQAIMDVHGTFDSSACTGYDANAGTDLAGLCRFV